MELIDEYASFEKTCNAKLKQMALFFIKQATELKKESMQIWFQNALKPRALSSLNKKLVA